MAIDIKRLRSEISNAQIKFGLKVKVCDMAEIQGLFSINS